MYTLETRKTIQELEARLGRRLKSPPRELSSAPAAAESQTASQVSDAPKAKKTKRKAKKRLVLFQPSHPVLRVTADATTARPPRFYYGYSLVGGTQREYVPHTSNRPSERLLVIENFCGSNEQMVLGCAEGLGVLGADVATQLVAKMPSIIQQVAAEWASPHKKVSQAKKGPTLSEQTALDKVVQAAKVATGGKFVPPAAAAAAEAGHKEVKIPIVQTRIADILKDSFERAHQWLCDRSGGDAERLGAVSDLDVSVGEDAEAEEAGAARAAGWGQQAAKLDVTSSGASLCLAVLKGKHLVVAHVGACRAVLGRRLDALHLQDAAVRANTQKENNAGAAATSLVHGGDRVRKHNPHARPTTLALYGGSMQSSPLIAAENASIAAKAARMGQLSTVNRLARLAADVGAIDTGKPLPAAMDVSTKARNLMTTESFPSFPDLPLLLERALWFPAATYVKPSAIVQQHHKQLVATLRSREGGSAASPRRGGTQRSTSVPATSRHGQTWGSSSGTGTGTGTGTIPALQDYSKDTLASGSTASTGGATARGATASSAALPTASQQEAADIDDVVSRIKHAAIGSSGRMTTPSALRRAKLDSAGLVGESDGSDAPVDFTVVPSNFERTILGGEVRSRFDALATRLGLPPRGGAAAAYEARGAGPAVTTKLLRGSSSEDLDGDDAAAAQAQAQAQASSNPRGGIGLPPGAGSLTRAAFRSDESVLEEYVQTHLSPDKTAGGKTSTATATAAAAAAKSLRVADEEDGRWYDDAGAPIQLVVPVPLSIEHRPDRPDEATRIYARGGKVDVATYSDGSKGAIPRVFGLTSDGPGLSVSRCLGYTSATAVGVLHEPEIITRSIEPADRFIILASDGLWSVVSSEEAVSAVDRVYRSILWGGTGDEEAALKAAAAAAAAEAARAAADPLRAMRRSRVSQAEAEAAEAEGSASDSDDDSDDDDDEEGEEGGEGKRSESKRASDGPLMGTGYSRVSLRDSLRAPGMTSYDMAVTLYGREGATATGTGSGAGAGAGAGDGDGFGDGEGEGEGEGGEAVDPSAWLAAANPALAARPLQAPIAAAKPVAHVAPAPSTEVRVSVCAGQEGLAGCGGASAIALDLLESMLPRDIRVKRQERIRRVALASAEALVQLAQRRWQAHTAKQLAARYGAASPAALSAASTLANGAWDDISALVMVFDHVQDAGSS